MRRNIQMVFQDPYTSLNPRMTVGDIIGEPFDDPPRGGAAGRPAQARCRSCSTSSGSTPSTSTATRTSSPAVSASASAIARGLALQPEIIVCDEPVSALDVSVQAQVINLLEQAAGRVRPVLHLHRARPVGRPAHLRPGRRHVPRQDRRDGRPRPRSTSTRPPVHPGAAVGGARCPTRTGRENRERILLTGDVPSPANPPSGCRFRTRCWKAQEICAEEEPPLDRAARHGHVSACHFAEERDVVSAVSSRGLAGSPRRQRLPSARRRKSTCSSSRFSATTSCGVMWVTPDSGSTVCGRPAASSAEDSRRVCATTTLSSASPWMSSSGRSSSGRLVEQRRRRVRGRGARRVPR